MNQKELDKILDNHKLWLKTNGEQGEVDECGKIEEENHNSKE